MQPNAPTPREQLATLLSSVIGHLTRSGHDPFDSRFERIEDLVQHMRLLKLRVERGDPSALNDCVFEFVATNTVCEVALANGWGDQYMSLAERSDELVAQLKESPY